MSKKGNRSRAGFSIIRKGDNAELCLSGSWLAASARPSPMEVFHQLIQGELSAEVSITSDKEMAHDMSLITFVFTLQGLCRREGIKAEFTALPASVVRLLQLATAVPEHEDEQKKDKTESLLVQIGRESIAHGKEWRKSLEFVGECALMCGRFITGRAQFRWRDVGVILQDCGPRALPIVVLIGFLMGLILAYVGAIQLRLFGAEIFVADLVGIGIVRTLGAIMTGIVMAGRTGASFAAELGTMQVNEEIDALKTLGISPYDFLVLPRILGLTLMMPLLCLFADLVGLTGGLVVGVGVLDLPLKLYVNKTIGALNMTHIWIGLFISLVFGILVAIAGCKQGIYCGRSSSSVGEATNAAVVNSIINIVVATAIITVLCNVLGI